MNPENASINHNVLVIAGTGGGKTKSVVETNLLHSWHKSMVVLLTKRRLINIYSYINYVRRNNRRYCGLAVSMG